MSSTSYKAAGISHEMANKLLARLNGSLALVEGFDTDHNPLITIGTGVAGTANFIIKTLPVPWPTATDVLGLSALQYSPTLIQMATEADPTGGAGADPISPAQLMLVLGQVVGMGTRVEWYQSTSGTAPTAATLADPTKLKSSFETDIYHAMVQDA